MNIVNEPERPLVQTNPAQVFLNALPVQKTCSHCGLGAELVSADDFSYYKRNVGYGMNEWQLAWTCPRCSTRNHAFGSTSIVYGYSQIKGNPPLMAKTEFIAIGLFLSVFALIVVIAVFLS